MNRGLALFLFLCASSVPASAQIWPNRPIHMYVAQGAGGGQDTIIRYISDKLSQVLGQSIIVENRPGAGAVIGTQASARAVPDGYNFAVTSSAAIASNPHLVKNLPYDPIKDFIPVALLSKPGFLISVRSSLDIRGLGDVVALEKKSPGSLSVVIDGPRNASGLTAAYFNKVSGANLRMVPYTSPSQGLQDVIGGNVDMFIAPPGIHMPHIEAGKLRPLGVSGKQREPALPDVPSVSEAFPGFSITGWLMVSAPSGSPREAVEKMNLAIDRILKDPAVVAWMQNFGSPSNMEAGNLTALSGFVRDEIALWGKIVESIGLSPQ